MDTNVAEIITTASGHMSLEFSEGEIPKVRSAISRIDPNSRVTRHIDSSTVAILGEDLTAVIDEMGCGLISGSDCGDEILIRLMAALSHGC